MDYIDYIFKYDEIVTSIITPVLISNGENVHPYNALWDTGAEVSAISKQVVQDLDLVSFMKGEMFGSHGGGEDNFYRISVTLQNGVRFDPIFANSIDFPEDGVDMLLGMDIISKGDFHIVHQDKTTTMVFRCQCAVD